MWHILFPSTLLVGYLLWKNRDGPINCSDLVEKMQPVCKSIITVYCVLVLRKHLHWSSPHLSHVLCASPSLFYVITDIYGAHVHSRLCTSCHFCCYIKCSQWNDYSEGLGWNAFFTLNFKCLFGHHSNWSDCICMYIQKLPLFESCIIFSPTLCAAK